MPPSPNSDGFPVAAAAAARRAACTTLQVRNGGDPLGGIEVGPAPAGPLGMETEGLLEEERLELEPLRAAASLCFLFSRKPCNFCFTSEEATALCSCFSFFLRASRRSRSSS